MAELTLSSIRARWDLKNVVGPRPALCALSCDLQSFPGRDCKTLPQDLELTCEKVIQLAFSALAYLSLLHNRHQPLILRLSHADYCDDQQGMMNKELLPDL